MSSPHAPLPRRWQVDATRVDLDLRRVWRGGVEVGLTPQEVGLLEALLEADGAPVSRDALLREVWGFPKAVPTRAVDHAMSRLRAKVEADPRRPVLLHTVRGGGYRLELPDVHDLVGRRSAWDALDRATARPGVVTLVGPSGMGKTALAEAWAARRGVPVVRLPGGGPVDVAVELARQLDVPIGPAVSGAAALVRIASALRRRTSWVVLDDALEAGADGAALAAAFRAGPGVVATAVVPLGWPGERVVRLGPLDDGAARRLLARRAPGLELDDGVIARLGGVPLALGLAASLGRTIGPDGVVAVLDAPGTGVLDAVLDRSWAQLDVQERDVLLVRAVLDGPWPMAAVCDALDQAPQAVAEALTRLDAAGLLRVDGGGCLPPIRSATRARLADHGPLVNRLARALVSRGEGDPGDRVRLARRVVGTHPDVAAALVAPVGQRLLVEGPLRHDVGPVIEAAADRLEGAAATPFHLLAGALATVSGDREAAARRLDAARHGPPAVACEAEVRLAWLALLDGRPDDAARGLERALADAVHAGAPDVEAMARVRRAHVAHLQRDPARAARLLEEAAGAYDALGDRAAAARARSSLALMAWELGDPVRARTALEEAVALDRAGGVRLAVPQHLVNLGGVALDLDETAEARRHLEAAIAEAEALGDSSTAALAGLSLAAAHLLDGDAASGLRRASEARTRLEAHGPASMLGHAWVTVALARLLGDAPRDARDALAAVPDDAGPAALLAASVRDALEGRGVPVGEAEGAPTLVRVGRRVLARWAAGPIRARSRTRGA